MPAGDLAVVPAATLSQGIRMVSPTPRSPRFATKGIAAHAFTAVMSGSKAHEKGPAIAGEAPFLNHDPEGYGPDQRE